MGRHKPSKPHRERPVPPTTCEPEPALPGWPRSHVSVDLTGDDSNECVSVTIHGVDHLLHATTARALSDALLEKLDQYNEGIEAILRDPEARRAHEDAMAMLWVPGTPRPSLDDLIV